MYVVIENTPGYLPENDDPATFETLDEARAYLAEEVERYLEHMDEVGDDPDVSWSDERDSCYVTRSDSEHDLGRVFEIVEAEPEA